MENQEQKPQFSDEDVNNSLAIILRDPNARAAVRYLRGIVNGDAYYPGNGDKHSDTAYREGQRQQCRDLLLRAGILVID